MKIFLAAALFTAVLGMEKSTQTKSEAPINVEVYPIGTPLPGKDMINIEVYTDDNRGGRYGVMASKGSLALPFRKK